MDEDIGLAKVGWVLGAWVVLLSLVEYSSCALGSSLELGERETRSKLPTASGTFTSIMIGRCRVGVGKRALGCSSLAA